MKTVTVIGGLTMDLTYYVRKWPKLSEAVQADSYILKPGGKGLNFSTSCSRLGLNVNLVSSLGNDNFSDEVRKVLKKEKISPRFLIVAENTPTDLIGIIVKDKQPGFIGIINSTGYLSENHISELHPNIWKADAVLINCEVDISVVKKVLEIAKSKSLTSILNPAPPLSNFDYSVLSKADYFIPNEWEASVLSNIKPGNLEQTADFFLQKGASNVIITKGDKGCYFKNGRHSRLYKAFDIEEVDETAAGDSFCAAVAYCLSNGYDLDEMVRFSSAAGALTCMKAGSYGSQPYLNEVEKFLESRKGEKL